MRPQRKSLFKIASMDSLGQGVSKETDKITFIPKVLPDETGEATILAEKKGVSFGRLDKLIQTSPHRIKPICPHFDQCPSCHYLHTTYEQELLFKEQNLEKMFFKIPHPKIQVHGAPRRTHYRNRIQLHYDRSTKKLGMLDAKNHSIAPIPQCLIGSDRVIHELQDLYQDQKWLKLAQNLPAQGHVEIYESDEGVKTNWNRPYAEGGFTQVFEEMNQLLKNMLKKYSQSLSKVQLLDLFGGNGNLSHDFNYSRRLCVDIYQKAVSDPFFHQDLYDKNALQNVLQKLQQTDLNPDVLLIDPPRSGLKNLNEWVEELAPQKLIYVSCDPHTMVRDLSAVSNYRLQELHLLDFFPSTYHFETVAFLERK